MNTKKSSENSKQMVWVVLLALVSVAVITLWISFGKNKPIEQNKNAENPPTAAPETKEIFFASNGKSNVYKIKNGDKWSVIWNGTQGKDYDFVSNPVFSFDGSQLAYNAELGGQAYVVVNNQLEINAYQKGGYIVFSKDGKVIAFVASKSDGTSLIITSSTSGTGLVSGDESKPYQNIVTIETESGNRTAIVLSENGERIAYAIEEGDKTYLIIDGHQTTGYDSVSNFTFNENGTYSYQAQQGDNTMAIVNGVVVSVTNSGGNSSSNNNSSNNNTGSGTNGSSKYKYRISTDKDIQLDKNRLDYTGCDPNSSDCNF